MLGFNYVNTIIIFELASFSHQLMSFHRSLRDSKSPSVSKTLLYILTDLSNAVVYMISLCPPISNSSYTLTKLSGIIPRVPSFSCCITFFVLSWVHVFLFIFVDFNSIVYWDRKVLFFSLFKKKFLIITKSDLLDGNKEYVGIWKSQRILCHIFLNRFRFMYIPFGWMIVFQFFAQFSMNNLPRSFMSSLILFLY